MEGGCTRGREFRRSTTNRTNLRARLAGNEEKTGGLQQASATVENRELHQKSHACSGQGDEGRGRKRLKNGYRAYLN